MAVEKTIKINAETGNLEKRISEIEEMMGKLASAQLPKKPRNKLMQSMIRMMS